MTDWAALQANYQPLDTRSQYAPKKKKVGGLQEFIANAAPLVGGTLGAIGGSFAAPVAGTAAGGAAGAGIGEAIKQNLLGEDLNIGNIAQEAAFGALPGAGKLLKGVVGAGKALKAGESIGGGFKAANIAKDTAGVVRPSTFTEKLNQGARNADMKQSGLEIGQTVRGKVLTPDAADELYNFGRSNGVKAGAPVEQARQAQELFKTKTGQLDETLNKIDRPVVSNEINGIAEDIRNRIGENAAITRGTSTANKLVEKVGKARTLKDLESIRREADDLAFTSTGAKKTSAAAQANEVRDAIDSFITPLSPEYKALKGDYMQAKGLLDLTSKGAKNAKGFNVFGVPVGQQSVPGTVSKGADIMKQITGGGQKIDQGALTSAFRPSQLLRKGIGQTIAQSTGNALLAPAEEVQPADTLPTDTGILPNPNEDTTGQPTSVYADPQAVERAYNRALAAGDKEAAGAILNGYKAFGESSKTTKPLSSESAKVLSNAKVGLDNLDLIEKQLAEDPSLQSKQGVSGSFNPFGITGAALGTGQYENARDQVKDVIARLRTGAAITKEEQNMFDKYVPQAADSPETVKQKINTLRNQFQFVMERAGGAGTDTQQLLGAQ
jgi:hypothetical protein